MSAVRSRQRPPSLCVAFPCSGSSVGLEYRPVTPGVAVRAPSAAPLRLNIVYPQLRYCESAAVVQLVRIPACHAGGRGSSPVRCATFQFGLCLEEDLRCKSFKSKINNLLVFLLGALSSVGRASALQAECRRFDPVSAHHICDHTLFLKYYCSAAVVQLVRIPACHAGGRGFEPVRCAILLIPLSRECRV